MRDIFSVQLRFYPKSFSIHWHSHHSSKMAYRILALLFFSLVALAARQPYDVRKIVQALKEPHDDLTLLCAHRGLRWNGTAENSREAFFRASEAGLECIEADINISADGQLPVIHHGGLGRTTNIGDFTGKAVYNPYTGEGYNPIVKDLNSQIRTASASFACATIRAA
jgi:glycerophosphoryl diester phosphodiesterase